MKQYMWKIPVCVSLFMALALPVFAQGTTAAPVSLSSVSTFTFTASPDQTALNTDGTPVVSGYHLLVFLATDTIPASAGTPAPQFMVDLGKPTPDTTNTITVSGVLALLQTAGLKDNVSYVAVTAAEGSGGESVYGGASVPFGHNFAKKRPAAPGPTVVHGGGD